MTRTVTSTIEVYHILKQKVLESVEFNRKVVKVTEKDFYDKNGKPIPIFDMPEYIRACLKLNRNPEPWKDINDDYYCWIYSLDKERQKKYAELLNKMIRNWNLERIH